MAKITRELLESKNIGELRSMVVHDFGIVGMTKKRKSIIIDAILDKVYKGNAIIKGGGKDDSKTPTPKVVEHKPGVPKQMEMTLSSTIDKPHSKFGNRNTTTINVACGASKGSFPVVGKTISEIKMFLSEVLNIPKGFPSAMVNGKKVEDSYITQPGDNIEILKPAGDKGKVM